MRAHAVGEEENTVSYQQKVDRVQYEQSARHQWKSRIAYNQREGITQHRCSYRDSQSMESERPQTSVESKALQRNGNRETMAKVKSSSCSRPVFRPVEFIFPVPILFFFPRQENRQSKTSQTSRTKRHEGTKTQIHLQSPRLCIGAPSEARNGIVCTEREKQDQARKQNRLKPHTTQGKRSWEQVPGN
ncbi:hypothetical protein VTN49DRAFT_4207 [Thermomyces lanuginosus]|uniref:uncharacterized protein n=1 Tax=Thermomyces lanuginosus TaxID=5541 RepID=UPI0037441A06